MTDPVHKLGRVQMYSPVLPTQQIYHGSDFRQI